MPDADTLKAEELLDPVISSWDEGIARVRSDAKWLLGLLAAAATFLFGAGTLVNRPSLSWKDNQNQLVAAGIFAVAGFVALGIVVYLVARVFVPVTVSLADLHSKTQETFKRNCEEYFGPDADPAATPRDQLRGATHMVVLLREELAQTPATEANADARKVLTRQLQWAQERLDQMEAGAAALLDLDRYNRVATERGLGTVSRGFVVFFGITSLLCGIGFQLALSAPAEKPTEPEADVAAGSLATLTLTAKEGTDSFERWSALGLDACKPATPTVSASLARTAQSTATAPSKGSPPDTSGKVKPSILVYVIGGKGTQGEPYEVETIPESTAPGASCTRIRFNAPADLALASMPIARQVTITEVPDPKSKDKKAHG